MRADDIHPVGALPAPDWFMAFKDAAGGWKLVPMVCWLYGPKQVWRLEESEAPNGPFLLRGGAVAPPDGNWENINDDDDLVGYIHRLQLPEYEMELKHDPIFRRLVALPREEADRINMKMRQEQRRKAR